MHNKNPIIGFFEESGQKFENYAFEKVILMVIDRIV